MYFAQNTNSLGVTTISWKKSDITGEILASHFAQVSFSFINGCKMQKSDNLPKYADCLQVCNFNF